MLDPRKLQALSAPQIVNLTLRAATAQSRLLQSKRPDATPELRALLGFLSTAVLQFEGELRRRQREAREALEDLDPRLVTEVG